jgi:hypothetical protein
MKFQGDWYKKTTIIIKRRWLYDGREYSFASLQVASASLLKFFCKPEKW